MIFESDKVKGTMNGEHGGFFDGLDASLLGLVNRYVPIDDDITKGCGVEFRAGKGEHICHVILLTKLVVQAAHLFRWCKGNDKFTAGCFVMLEGEENRALNGFINFALRKSVLNDHSVFCFQDFVLLG